MKIQLIDRKIFFSLVDKVPIVKISKDESSEIVKYFDLKELKYEIIKQLVDNSLFIVNPILAKKYQQEIKKYNLYKIYCAEEKIKKLLFNFDLVLERRKKLNRLSYIYA